MPARVLMMRSAEPWHCGPEPPAAGHGRSPAGEGGVRRAAPVEGGRSGLTARWPRGELRRLSHPCGIHAPRGPKTSPARPVPGFHGFIARLLAHTGLVRPSGLNSPVPRRQDGSTRCHGRVERHDALRDLWWLRPLWVRSQQEAGVNGVRGRAAKVGVAAAGWRPSPRGCTLTCPVACAFAVFPAHLPRRGKRLHGVRRLIGGQTIQSIGARL